MLNLKNIFSATALLLVAITSASALEIELDNFTYNGPNTVFIGVDGDPVSALPAIIEQATGRIITVPQGVDFAATQTTNTLLTANVEFNLILDESTTIDQNGNIIVSQGDAPLASDFLSFATVSNGFDENNVTDTTLVFDEQSGIDAQLAITYTDAAGGLFDISAFDAFYVDVLDAFEGFILNLTVEDADNTVAFLEVEASTANALSSDEENVTRLLLDFSDLSGDIDLTSITQITATITSPGVSADLVLTSVGLVQVTEPATLAIFGLALLGFAVRRRTRSL